jgi:hypothetical protein
MDDKQPADVAAQTATDPAVLPLAGMNAPETVPGAADREPSKPWFGGVILACLALAAVWVLTYTLAPLPGQKALGGWNYVVVGTLLSGFIGLSKAWHGEPPHRSERAGQAGRTG